MLPALPFIILTLSTLAGGGGVALGAKATVDSLEANRKNSLVQERNDKNLLMFQSCTDILNDAIERLGETRFKISKNFKVFAETFEKIHNRPSFSKNINNEFFEFDFDEIKNISVIANEFIGGVIGAAGGSLFAAAAATGIKSAVMALGKASTGIEIAKLNGAAAIKAALAALGGGAIAAGGGGIALGTLVLNAASFGVGILFEGFALAYTASIARKQADKAYSQMQKNEKLIQNAIDMQIEITGSAKKLTQSSANIYKNIYSPLMLKMKDIVNVKTDWNLFSEEERLLVENTILTVKILHHLNNIPIYQFTINNKDEIEDVKPNSDEVEREISNAKSALNWV